MTWEKFTISRRRFGIPEFVALVFYAGLGVWLTLRHDPWADEAQSWLLARDYSFMGMLRQIHYEGTPALWHVLLWTECRLHIGYAGMHWISSGIGTLSAFLLLRYSPFPRWMKLLLPFSSYLLFQSAIVARSYGLAILLIFSLAALFRSNRKNVVVACVLCGLLANTSLYGFLAAVGLSFLFLREAFRSRQKFASTGALIVCISVVVALQQTIPAPDAGFHLAGVLNKDARMRKTFSVLTGIPLNPRAVRAVEMQDAAAAADIKANPENAAAAHKEETGPVSIVLSRIKLILHAAIYMVSSSIVLGLLIDCALICWLVVHRRTQAAVPLALVLVCGAALNYTEHHVLMLWGVLVAVLWIAWPQVPEAPRLIDKVFCVLLLAMLVEQVGWSVNAFRQDVYGHFDPGKQLATFLEENATGRRIDTVTYYEVSSQPYLRANPFHNVATANWPWALDKDPAQNLTAVAQDNPDMIVASENTFGKALLANVLRTHVAMHQPFYADRVVSRLQALGYKETHRFCGRQPMHFSYSEENCLVILEPIRK